MTVLIRGNKNNNKTTKQNPSYPKSKHSTRPIVFHQNLKFCASKNTIKRVKRQPIELKEIFANHISVKDFYPEYIKNNLQLNNKKII